MLEAGEGNPRVAGRGSEVTETFVQATERRLLALEKDSHPPIDLEPLVQEIIDRHRTAQSTDTSAALSALERAREAVKAMESAELIMRDDARRLEGEEVALIHSDRASAFRDALAAIDRQIAELREPKP
jgi:hypothetical protein